MANRFTTRQWVPFQHEVVFAFFANPHNLPKLMPQASQTRIEELRLIPPRSNDSNAAASIPHKELAAGIGSEIMVSFRPVPWLSFRARWLARITEFAWGSHFCDQQVQGPFAVFNHCHRLQPEMQGGASGTAVMDEITYALPFGYLGRMGGSIVRRQLEKTFAERQQRLVQLIAND